MIKLKDILNEIEEAKQVGQLYHFTSYENALKIIKDNFNLKPSPSDESEKDDLELYNLLNHDTENYVSFTRNKNLNTPTISSNVRFNIDGNKLSNKYTIEPYADVKGGYGRNVQTSITDESEERILAKKYGGKVNFKDSLLSIDIKIPNIVPNSEEDEEMGYEPPQLSKFYELLSYLKNNNISFNILKNNKKVEI